MTHRFALAVLAILAIAEIAGSAATAQNTYSVTTIPLLKGASSAIPRALNTNGEVVGTSSSSVGWYFKSSVNGGSPVAIQPPSGLPGLGAYAINTNGYVVGYASGYAFVWKYGVNSNQALLLNQISAHFGGRDWVVINAANQIVSQRDVLVNGLAVPHGCAWEMDAQGHWQVADLPPLSEDNCSRPQAINASGLVVGTSCQAWLDATGQWMEGPQRLAAWRNDPLTGAWSASAIPDTVTGASMYNLTNVNNNGEAIGLAFSTSSTQGIFIDTTAQTVTPMGVMNGSRGLNDYGQACGWANLGIGSRAMYWDKTRGANNLLNLGTLGGSFSRASGSMSEDGNCHINSAGYVVGFSTNSTGSYYGFVWDPTRGMRDLNAITPSKSGFNELDAAWAISDSGQIVGVGIRRGAQTPYLLTPQ